MPTPVCSSLKENVLATSQVVVYTIIVPVQVGMTVYCAHQLCRAVVARVHLKYSFLAYLIFSTIYIIMNGLHDTLGRAYEWPILDVIYCRLFVVITWGSGFCYSVGMELFWFSRLELAFTKTVFEIKRWQRYIYWILVYTFSIIYFGLVGLMATASDMCAVPLIVQDFNPFPNVNTLYTCAGWPVWYERVYLVLGAIMLTGLNFYLSYAYISRLAIMMRRISHGAVVVNREETSQLYKVQRSSIVAVTSIISTITALTVAAIFTDVGYIAIPFDICLNGVCMMCAFKFGDGIYKKVFGRCVKAINDRAGIKFKTTDFTSVLSLGSMKMKSNTLELTPTPSNLGISPGPTTTSLPLSPLQTLDVASSLRELENEISLGKKSEMTIDSMNTLDRGKSISDEYMETHL